MKHATITVGEYEIPLIGIKPSSVEERCDLCGKIKHIQKIELRDTKFVCLEGCNEPNPA